MGFSGFDVLVSENRWASYYFFVQTLANWHFSCSPYHRKAWLARIPDLNKKLLRDFAILHKKYSFDNPNPLFGPFFACDSPLEELAEFMHEQEVKLIQQIQDSFWGVFEDLYYEQSKQIDVWVSEYNKCFASAEYQEKHAYLVGMLERFYSFNRGEGVQLLVLLAGVPELVTASAYADQGVVIMPLGLTPISKMGDSLALLWHEIIHVNFDCGWLRTRLQERDLTEEQQHMIVEFTAAALFPLGLLRGEFVSSSAGSERLYDGLGPNEYQKSILQLVRDYFQKKKSIDDSFIDRASEIVG